LKLVIPYIHNIYTIRVEKAIPLKQGLKQVEFYKDAHSWAGVEKAIPLKQGLKQKFLKSPDGIWVSVEKAIPLKQGLKQISFSLSIFSLSLSKRQFH